MREIKFRAWDKINKKMISLTDIDKRDYVAIGGTWEIYNSYTEKCLLNHKNGILMQFTGLKDKNGKEIFEGDIIKGIIGDISVKRVVFWEIFEGYTFFEDIDFNYLEVIGNIYENPELLGEKGRIKMSLKKGYYWIRFKGEKEEMIGYYNRDNSKGGYGEEEYSDGSKSSYNWEIIGSDEIYKNDKIEIIREVNNG